MQTCQYLGNLGCPPHLKKDKVELGKIARKASGMIKGMTQLLRKEQLSRLGLFRLKRGWIGSSILETLI